ncbi:thioredoxin [Listeria monocytogenes]|nr:thioredoxin [Listeria monocytogenes]GAT40813.1 thioredoxin [Listeria monocytogenes]
MRQGPHHVAQKSVNTKPSLVSCSNVASVISFTMI